MRLLPVFGGSRNNRLQNFIMANPLKKSETLRERREKFLSRLNAQIAEADRKESSRQRKDDTRRKIIIGACVLADYPTHPEVNRMIADALKRNALPRDLQFLEERGW